MVSLNQLSELAKDYTAALYVDKGSSISRVRIIVLS